MRKLLLAVTAVICFWLGFTFGLGGVLVAAGLAGLVVMVMYG